MKFPDNFRFGVATSSYQIEGAVDVDGRGKSIWDTFSATPGKVARGESGAVANDHYHRYPEDLSLMKDIGVDAYRLSIAWPRLFPNGDGVRESRGFDFYDRLIDATLEKGIEPFLTLYHWDLPQALQDKGGWTNRSIINSFADYSLAVAEHFGDRVKHFTPINEPWVVSWLGYGLGYHAPGLESKDLAIKASHLTIAAHNASFKAIKSVVPGAKVGPVLNQSGVSIDDLYDPKQLRAAEIHDQTMNKFWMDGHFKGEYSQDIWDMYGNSLEEIVQPGDLELVANDWFGINYYFNQRVGHEIPIDSESRVRVVDQFAGYASEGSAYGKVTDMGWPITAHGLGDLLIRWTREYGDAIPQMFITENGVAFDDGLSEDGEIHDQRRIDYLNDHLYSVLDAINRGADVGGYFQWSLMDNFEWAMGYEKRFGLIHVDFDSLVRTPKDSAKFYRDTIKARGENLTISKSFMA